MINKENVLEEAKRCLNCKTKPCQKACPFGNDIPQMLEYVKNDNFNDAFATLLQTSYFSTVCGRICPHEKNCEGHCTRGIKGEPIKIGMIESTIGDYAVENKIPLLRAKNKIMALNDKNKANEENLCNKEDEQLNESFSTSQELKNNISNENTNILLTSKIASKKVAVVGGGPAGIACALELVKNGVNVTIFEKYNELGGILSHGIPDFRLPREVIFDFERRIIETGIKIEYNSNLGENLFINQLQKDFDKVFVAIGSNISSKMHIEGEELEGVYGANEYLEGLIDVDLQDKIVIVNGGGNVAMDMARTAKHKGAKEVHVVYRRSQKEMPAEQKEISDAINDGIIFDFQTNISKLSDDVDLPNKLSFVECIKTQLVQKEGESRLVPINIERSNFNLNADLIFMAIGSHPDEKVVAELNVELNKYGQIIVNDKMQTSNQNIYAGGDAAGIKATVATAAKSGMIAARAIVDDFVSES